MIATTQETTSIFHEPAEAYHGKAKDFLSSHQLADFRKSPLLYHRKKLGLIPDVDHPAYVIGRATHTLILEGKEKFDEEYAVGGPVNKKTGKPYGKDTKAFAQWTVQQGKPVLTQEQFDLIRNMAIGVALHEKASEILSTGIAEGVVRAEYCDVPCQIRMDWFNPQGGLADLKTCDDLTWFEADSRRWGYAHQMAFYRAVLAVAIGTAVPVHLIAIEKRQPFRCGLWRISDDVLAAAQKENEAAIRRLKRCQEKDTWLSGYEEPRVFDYI